MIPEYEIIATRRMGTRGRLQIPKEVRDKLGVKEGDLILFLEDYRGNIIIKKAPKIKKYTVTEI